MNVHLERCLTAADISSYLSPYLTEGRKHESWQIDAVEIIGKKLIATVSMRTCFTSATDTKGFHLTIFSSLEFLSQLMIIYVHVWAGLASKTREGWMVESATRSIRAIRNPENIRVVMDVDAMRKRGESIYCAARYCITDDQNGLFEATLKGFLS